MLKEFKEFALRGNVMDMAVGVVIGGAFGKIVTSLVQDIMMPIFGFLTAGWILPVLRSYSLRQALTKPARRWRKPPSCTATSSRPPWIL